MKISLLLQLITNNNVFLVMIHCVRWGLFNMFKRTMNTTGNRTSGVCARNIYYYGGGILKGKDLRGITLCKITNIEENHNGFQFVTGKNTDVLPFNPSGSCTSGGIYFCEEKLIGNYFNYRDIIGHYIRLVTLDADEDVYVDNFKFKAKTVHLGERRKIVDYIADIINNPDSNDNLFSEYRITRCDINRMMMRYPETLRQIPDSLKTEEMCYIAVNFSSELFKFVPDHLRTKDIIARYNEEITKKITSK